MKNKKAFIHAVLVLPHETLQGYLLEEEGKIISYGAGELFEKALDGYEIIDCKGKYLSPGFIDMHTHGAGGYDFLDGTEAAIKGACMEHLKHGTTSICPTAMSATFEEYQTFFDTYRKVKNTWIDGPELLGVHLEGPFFNASQAGAQDPKVLQKPTEEAYSKLLTLGGEDIARVSAAVELEGAIGLGKELKTRGIIAAIGHSDADYHQVLEAVENGYSLVTHLYSGMSALHRVGPYRVLGVVEASYLLDDLTVEIIADGKHLPPELLKLILKCKDHDKICLVTDSMRGAGLPNGTKVMLGSLTGGQEVLLQDSVAMMPDMKAFAGSVCTTDRCIRTMHRLAGVCIEEAVRMMTLNPARVLGVDNRKGSIAEGKDADLVIFDEDIQISAVYVAGRNLA